MHISLTPELQALVHKKVASGMYNNASEVIREALRTMDLGQQALYQSKLNALNAMLQAGFDSGESSGSVFDVMDEVLAEETQQNRSDKN
jgi:antitoxin ParD1/3/4